MQGSCKVPLGEYFDQELNGRPSAILAGSTRLPEVTVAQLRRRPL